jgi:hypothetical protein
MKYAVTGLLIGLICTLPGRAQDYHAIEGSPYAGAIGAANNPASIVNTSYPWDITFLSLEEKNTTNAIRLSDFSYISKDTIHYTFSNGYMKRYVAFSFNVHLLNVRLSFGRKQAIAFGANLQGYGAVRAGPANYIDTLKNMNEFFNVNEGTTYNGNMASSAWIELFGTYSRTLMDDAYGRLNGGITLKAMRGISGAYAQLENGSVNRTIPPGSALTVYDLAAGTGRYGYSSNYDDWKAGGNGFHNLEEFLVHTRLGTAADVGFEYLVKPQTVDVFDEGDSYYDYDWKVGVSLLDVGENVYKYGSQSKVASDPKTNVTDSELNEKFGYLKSVAGFNDSMSLIVQSFHNLRGMFKVWNPTRLVVNVDRPLPDHFAVNANLILNLGGSNTGQRLFTKEITLLAVTPRWETKKLGGYLPVQVTTDGKLWVGGAFRAGPLLLGIDNWMNLIAKSKMANGGFYLALVIKPGKGFSFKEDRKYTCPVP